MSYYNLKNVCISGIWVNGVLMGSANVAKAKSIRVVLVDEKGRTIEESDPYTLSQEIELKIVADQVGSISTQSGDISGQVKTVGQIVTMSGAINLVADTVEGDVSSMSGDVTVEKGTSASSMYGKVSRK